jgi:hypothetical protein
MKRHIVASGATALALCLGAGQALAADPVLPVELPVPVQPTPVGQNPLAQFLAQLLGIGDPPPGVSATAGAAHATSTGDQGIIQEQAVPATVAAAVSSISNVDAPVGIAGGVEAAGRGTAFQASTSQATASAANDATQQSSEAAGQGGAGQGVQASLTQQGVPVAIGAAISAPVNLNAPIGILAAKIAGDVSQAGEALAEAAAINNNVDQLIQGGSGGGIHGQLSDSRQSVPITLGLALSAPLNLNLPINILDPGQINPSGGYTDLFDLLRGILSIAPEEGVAGGEVRQTSTSEATAVAANNAVEQSAATGTGEATQITAAQQVVPAAIAAALSLPVNANLPVGVLQTSAVEGAEVNQDNGAETRAAANNFDASQEAESQGGGSNTSLQTVDNDQLLPIAVATDLAVPINLNLPVTLLGYHVDGTGPIDLSVVQRTLDAVDALVADPAGTLQTVLSDPHAALKHLLKGE